MATWMWELSGTTGRPLDRPVSPEFGSRFDAEAWLGESWRTLSGQGVTTAALLCDSTAVAAPVSLPAVGD